MLIDKEKFVNWIECHHAALYKHAFWMTGNRALAEDLVQETFYQAWNSRHNIENTDNPLPWLLTVLRRAVYKEHQHSRLTVLDLNEENIEELSNGTEDDFATLVDLGNALMCLSPRQREMLLLFGLHGFSYQQISDQLNIPIGTVMSRIGRARQTLRAFYANEGSDPVVVPLRKKKEV